MKNPERKTLRFDYPVQAGSTIMNMAGQVVGQILQAWKIRQEPDEWEAEVDIDADTDVERLQVMPPYGVTGGVNA